MARLKIKSKENPKERHTKLKFLELLSTYNVYATSFHETSDGFTVIIASDHEADKILEPQVAKKLTDNGFNPIPPQEYKSRRTIICYKVEETTFEHSANDIADGTERLQDWTKIQNCFKFPNNTINRRNMIKIEFDTMV